MADGGKGWVQGLFSSLVKSETGKDRAIAPSLAPRAKAKGFLLDPLVMQQSSGGFYTRTPMSYEALRLIAYNAPLIKAIIGTRISQVQAFARRPKHDFDLGIRVRPTDPNAKLTPATRKEADYITNFILQCGVPGRDRAVTGDNFRTFTAKVVRDSLIFDQLNWQNRFRRDGKPYEMVAMPAMTMRIKQLPEEVASELGTESVIRAVSPDEPRYVQIYQERVIAEFTPRELAWVVRNPVSDVDHFGYGWSEIENMIPIIQGLSWAEEYNRRFFSQGAAIKGLINIKGDITQRQLEQFRNEWHALVTGVNNAFRTPVVASKEGVDWLPMHSNNREMEFSEWMNYLIKQACSHYQIAPEEVNFQYGNAGAGKSMFENSQESKLKWSRDRGLRPLLNAFEDGLNANVVQQINPDFVMEFYGLDVEDEKDRLEMVSKYVTTVLTIDEGRKMINRDPLADGSGGIILSPVWMQAKTAASAGANQPPAVGGADAADDGMEFSPDDFADKTPAKPAVSKASAQAVDKGAFQDDGAVEGVQEVQKSRTRKVVRITTIEV